MMYCEANVGILQPLKLMVILECVKEPQGMPFAFNYRFKKKNNPFEVCHLNLQTVGMDLFHYFCGSYCTGDMMCLSLYAVSK